MNFIERVSVILKERKITQKQLLEALGMSKNVYKNWKDGINEPPQRTKMAIASYLGVTVDYLEGRTEKENDPAEARSQVEKDVEEIMSLLAAMPEEKREAAKAEIVNYLKVKGLV